MKLETIPMPKSKPNKEELDELPLFDYVVVLRALSAAIFKPTSPFRVVDHITSFGKADIIFYTHYEDLGLGVSVPRYLLIDVRGKAPSLNDAMKNFKAGAMNLVTSVAFSVNAYIDSPNIYLAFDITPGKEEREFFQTQFPDRSGELERSRYANSEATAKFHTALFKAKNAERLRRAVGQYHLALGHWEFGKEILAIEHLFIAAEIITPVIRTRLFEEYETDADGLAEQLGVEKNKLDSEIRRKYIFQDDTECYKKAKLASDSFEHGFEPFDIVRGLARDACDSTARYLRASIIDLLTDDQTTKDLLNENDFIKPFMKGKVRKELRGHLIGSGDNLARDGDNYPYMDWASRFNSGKVDEAGVFTYNCDETFTACFAKGLEFKLQSMRMWGPPTEYKKKPIENADDD